MKIFITGASGFIGGAIGEKLKASHIIHAMARSEKSMQKVKELGFVPIKCELGNVQKEDLRGIEVIIHSAAYVEAWGTMKQYWEANVEGTRQLLQVAQESGVKKFIHIGTEACLFYGQHMDNVDETYPYAFDSPYPYSSTKAEAEKSVLEANKPEVFETMSVRPRMVWGPGDQTILPEVLKMIEKGSFAWVNKGQALTSTTHIDNLVRGVELALSKGKGGEAYFITDEDVSSIKYFLSGLLDTQNVKPPTKSVPSYVLRPLARVVEGAWRLFGIKNEPPITRFAADMMSVNGTINIDKAKRELGYVPVINVEKGFRELKNKKK